MEERITYYEMVEFCNTHGFSAFMSGTRKSDFSNKEDGSITIDRFADWLIEMQKGTNIMTYGRTKEDFIEDINKFLKIYRARS